MAWNDLEAIPNLCFADFEPKFRLYLNNNPLQCGVDAGMKWSVWAAKSGHVNFQFELSQARCAGPPALKDKMVEDVYVPRDMGTEMDNQSQGHGKCIWPETSTRGCTYACITMFGSYIV